MKKTLIVTAVVVVLGGVAVNEAYKAFNNSPLGTLKKLSLIHISEPTRPERL